jgi:A/G-specific adenine glycosylase
MTFLMTGKKIIFWYGQNKRNLPWRDTDDPYYIWVSEIILQQTRVNQGLDYYLRFVETFPDVESLANAKVDKVLKIWQGLGYYSRARHMHEAAGELLSVYGGKFPKSYRELIKIKGIGDYTAAAIASFAFGEAVPVVDGNVNRVMTRLFGITDPIDTAAGKKQVRACAEKSMVRETPGLYNQAVMEFGALQCVPHNPDCAHCVLQAVCVAHVSGLTDVLPVKSKALNIKTRYFHYLVIDNGSGTWLQRRYGRDIWKGLYEFPMIETDMETSPDELCFTEQWKCFFGNQGAEIIVAVSPEITHRLTHRILKIRFYEIRHAQQIFTDGQIHILWREIRKYAVPIVIATYLNRRK